jgi:uncharacterized phage protein gp47/JayE
MSNFPRPALPDLIARVTQQVQINLPGASPALRRSVTVAVGKSLAQELMQEYAYLDFIAGMFFAASAVGAYLDRKGAEVGVPREAGAFAAGSITFTSTGGGTVAAGAVVQTPDGTQSFTLGAVATLGASGTTTSVAVTAQTLGGAGNLGAGAPLVLVVAVAGVSPNAVVASGGFSGGLDVETDANYRVRILARQQQPPQGGASRDYVAWAKQYPGVTRAWVYPLNRGAGTVDVAFVFDARGPGTGAIVPGGGDVTAVQAVITANRPVTADARAIALSIAEISVIIGSLVASPGYTKPQALTNATASLIGLFSGSTPGGATYGDGIPPGGSGGTIFLEQIISAIANSEGVGSFDLTSPTADLVASSGTILLLNTVTAP